MSTTTAQQTHSTVTVQMDDPFTSLFQPSYDPGPVKTRKHSAFASAPIDTSQHKAQTYIRDAEPRFSDPLLQPHSTLATEFVPKDEYQKVKRSARDGWTAVMVLGTFIAVGLYWVVDRVGSDGVKIDALSGQVASLNKQIVSERGVVITRNKELQLLNEQLSDQRGRNAKNGNVKK